MLKRGFSRLGVLATLATLTVAMPLTGFAGVDASLSIPDRDIVTASSQTQSWSFDDNQVSPYDPHYDTNDADEANLNVPLALQDKGDAQARARILGAQEQVKPGCEPKLAARGEANITEGQASSAVIYPLPQGTFKLSSPFGYRIHPISNIRKLHSGTDMSAPAMTPVLAAADGIVLEAEREPFGANYIRIEHTINGQKVHTLYLHLYDGSTLVKPGQKVKAGQRIGGVGSTGQSTGNHLHFEVRFPPDDHPIDGWKWLHSNSAVYLGHNDC